MDLIKGTPTKSGNETFLYYNKEGRVVSVVPETAEKNGYKPVIKGAHDDSKMKDIKDNPDLEDIHAKEVERIRKAKEKKKLEESITEEKKKKEEIIPTLDSRIKPEDQQKIKELLEKREKIESDRKEQSDKLKKQIEIEEKRSEEVNRLRNMGNIVEEHEKQLVESSTNIEKQTRPIKEEVVEKLLTLKEKMKMKKSSNPIVSDMLKNPSEYFKKFIKENIEFEIFHNGNLIYTTKNTDKNKILIFEDYFEIFSKKYSYVGLRMKKI